MVSLLAQVYNGGGIDDGIDLADDITGVATADPRVVAINIIEAVLSYLALIAVAMVIAAGVYLIVSLGNDDNKEKAKKIVYYTIIGLIVVLFARIIVSLVTIWLPSQVG
jgi:uncharacterized protein involved in response to NO